MPPEPEDTAPAFEGLLCDGETFRPRSLADVRGERGTVLVFGGFVRSAIASNWWTRYENAGWHEFDGVPVLGVHRDGPYAVNAFLRERESPFSLFADVEGQIAAAYDLLTEREGMAGARTARRAIFVLDADGVVAHAWNTHDWISPVPRDEIRTAVEAL
jgi:peroxiredoxin